MSSQQPVENIQKISFSKFSFDFESKLLASSEGILDLAPKSTELLNLLLKNPGELVSREQISQTLWPDQVVDFDQNINFCIKQIRQILADDPKSPTYIATLPKKGYRFIAPYSLENSSLEPGTNPKPNFKTSLKLSMIGMGILLLIGLFFGFMTLQSDHNSNPAKPYLESTEAEQAVKRGFYLYDQGGSQNFLLAESLFEKALVLDPQLADAHAGLSLVKIYSAQNNAEREIVINHANKAFELNSQSAMVNLAKAKVSLYLDWNISDAFNFFHSANQINPNSIAVLHDLAVVATIQGKLTLAKASVEKALDIDPGRFQEHFHAGWFYQVAGQYDSALKQCVQSLEIEPNYYFSLLCAGRAALKLELQQKAQDYLQAFMQLYKESPEVISLVMADIHRGDSVSFNRWYLDLLHQRNADPFQLALAYGEIGETENALNQLEIAIQQKNLMVPTALVFDELKEIRLDERFLKLMSVVKL